MRNSELEVNEKLFGTWCAKEVTTSKPKTEEKWNDISSDQRNLAMIAQMKTTKRGRQTARQCGKTTQNNNTQLDESETSTAK